MAATAIPTVDEYWQVLEARLWQRTAPEQRLAVELYRELAKGEPTDAAQLGRALGISAAEVRALLQSDAISRLVLSNEEGRIIGFGGLATAPMHHRFEVGGRMLWTWCAWDSLFIPEILGETARVTSADPESGEIVRLVVSPRRVESAEPRDPFVSFVLPDADPVSSSAVNLMARFCHFVFFFASRRSGERWVAKHPGTFLFSLEDAVTLSKRVNARSLGSELDRR